MRPHGKARTDARAPRAHAICERCGFRYNHHDLSWDNQWIGPRITNLYHLVCPTCRDKPQENIRTIVLPPDPVPLMHARPEDFAGADNPISGIGFDPLTTRLDTNTGYGVFIGTMTQGGGLAAAFDNQTSKPSWRSARALPSNSGFGNTIGCNWSLDPNSYPTPTALSSVSQSYSILSVTVIAPVDQPFLTGSSAVNAVFQGSNNNGASWINLWSGNTVGSIGETLVIGSSVNLVTTNYGAHRFALNGDGVNTAAIAQITLTAAGPSAAQLAGVET